MASNSVNGHYLQRGLQRPDDYYNEPNARTVGTQDLALHCPLTLPIANSDPQVLQPSQLMGQLDRLPDELITPIFVQLDIPTLCALRCVNKRAHQLVSFIPQFRILHEHYPEILQAIIGCRATHFDLLTLYRTLHTTRCISCSAPGAFLYLISCSRVCYQCFTTNILFLPVFTTASLNATGLPQRQLEYKVPHIRSIRGTYAHRWQKHHAMKILWDRATIASLRVPPSKGVKPTCILPTDRISQERHSKFRFICVISAPFFSLLDSTSHWGYYCVGCCVDSKRAIDFPPLPPFDGRPIVTISRPATGFNIESRDVFEVLVLNQHMQKMIMAFDLQWALIKLLATDGDAEALDNTPDHPELLDEFWIKFLGDIVVLRQF
ncbi:hypothetical protein B0T19DRAFT_446581 [Cercophora scortea]|uniref:F-box domain-containing protein n=1 Tax=Cercophora scortea TaxID=314031 RepID=A0AAE0M355_9PEZI|nr:hypothetical protein B0T19DRAFT_446581 [Cercophora scortea]